LTAGLLHSKHLLSLNNNIILYILLNMPHCSDRGGESALAAMHALGIIPLWEYTHKAEPIGYNLKHIIAH
jgi:hypothetical protein